MIKINPDKRCIFRHVFTDTTEYYTNSYGKLVYINTAGGIVNKVYLNNFVWASGNAGLKWNLNTPMSTPFSLRIKMRINTTRSADNQYLLFNGTTAFNSYVVSSSNVVYPMPGGITYINGVSQGQYGAIQLRVFKEYCFVITPQTSLYGSFNILAAENHYGNFDADIEWFEIYSVALTAGEIKNLYEGRVNTIPFNDSSEVANFSTKNYSFQNKWNTTFYNGLNQFTYTKNELKLTASATANINYDLRNKSFTISTWYKTLNDANYLSLGTYVTNAGGFGITPYGTALYCFAYNDSSVYEANSVGNLGGMKYNHIAISFDKNTRNKKIYLNGVLAISNNTGLWTPSIAYTYIWNQSGLPGIKYFKNLRFFSKQLSDAEISQLYNYEKRAFQIK